MRLLEILVSLLGLLDFSSEFVWWGLTF